MSKQKSSCVMQHLKTWLYRINYLREIYCQVLCKENRNELCFPAVKTIIFLTFSVKHSIFLHFDSHFTRDRFHI